MMTSGVVRDRSSRRTASAGATESASVGAAQANPAEEAQRKYASRSRVLEEIVRLHRGRRATESASAAPAYQPMGARSGASERGAQKRAEEEWGSGP
jgi:hypothetical protein